MNQRAAYLYAISAVLLWSTVATAFKIALRHLDVPQLLLISSVTATLCLGLILFVQGRLAIVFTQSRQAYVFALLLGLLNPLAYYLILFQAYDLLPAQVAQPLNYTWAITLMLLSVPLLKQRLNGMDIIAALVSYSGVVVICVASGGSDETGLSALGVFLALASTLIWALYWIFKARDTLEPVASLFLSFLFSLPFIGLAVLTLSDMNMLSFYGLASAAYIGLFEMAVTYVLWLLALKNTESTAKISTLIFCSPFLSLILINYVLDEPVVSTTFIGLALIVSGLLLQQRYGYRNV